jgi:hypothetical protein
VSIAINTLAAAGWRVVADDLSEWTPRIVERFIGRAVAALPDEETRERFGEEWRSYVAVNVGYPERRARLRLWPPAAPPSANGLKLE